jgi:hypothetical protein
MGTMTKLPGVPDREQAIAGMAFYAGTGPIGQTCGSCLHRGYHRVSISGKSTRTLGCHVYKSLTGRHGAAINKLNRSCKYFEEAKRK